MARYRSKRSACVSISFTSSFSTDASSQGGAGSTEWYGLHGRWLVNRRPLNTQMISFYANKVPCIRSSYLGGSDASSSFPASLLHHWTRRTPIAHVSDTSTNESLAYSSSKGSTSARPSAARASPACVVGFTASVNYGGCRRDLQPAYSTQLK